MSDDGKRFHDNDAAEIVSGGEKCDVVAYGGGGPG